MPGKTDPLLFTRLTPFPAMDQSVWLRRVEGALKSGASDSGRSPAANETFATKDRDGISVVLWGTSQLEFEAILNRLRLASPLKFYGGTLQIAYQETIKTRARDAGKVTRDIGSRRLVSTCAVEVKPNSMGQGLNIVTSPGLASKAVTAVTSGIKDCLKEGVIIGRPLVDLIVAVVEARTEPEDSSPENLSLPAKLAVQAACKRASPTILEPIMNLQVLSPEFLAGDIIADLNSRRAKINEMGDERSMKVVRCTVPLSEILGYGAWLSRLKYSGMPSPQATFEATMSHWEEVPLGVFKAITDSHRSDDPPEASAGRPVKPLRPKPGVPGGQKKPLPPES